MTDTFGAHNFEELKTSLDNAVRAVEDLERESTEALDILLDNIEDHLAHHGKQSQTHYLRGYLKGVEWTKTEIRKVFER